MKTSHASVLLVLVLGSTVSFDPYQTASARPGPPALIQGITLTIEGAWLTWTGGVHVRHPLAADEAATNVCRWAGWLASADSEYVMKRLRPVSIHRTVNSTSGEAGRPSGVRIRSQGRLAASVL